MTLGCDNVSVAELHINGVVHARRNYHWQAQISCAGCQTCACNDWDSAHPAPNGWDNILHMTWVDLPAGVNTITTRGFRWGIGGVEQAIEVAVWRKECPPITTNVICIPATVIQEQGLCEFERLAAIYGTMVGCLQVSSNCSAGPDTYQDGPACIFLCEDDPICHIHTEDIATVPNPLGGQLMNTVTLNYPYDVRVQITWHTNFLQNLFVPCSETCPTCACTD